MSGAPVGIIGGYGDVGGQAARALHRAGTPLRIGGPRPRAAAAFAEEALGGGAEHRAVDVHDPRSLAAFADGLGVLLHCAGPAYRVGTLAADAALRAGADYVDPAGEEALGARIDAERRVSAGRTAVLAAGFRPGLTGLFPRAVADRAREEGAGRIRRLTMHCGLLDRFTHVAAQDYLQGTADGLTRSLAAWRDGGPRTAAGTRLSEAELPFFPGRSTVWPQMSAEDEQLAEDLGLEHGDWYTVLCGSQVTTAFERVHAYATRQEAADALCRASALDLAGREPFVTLAVTVGAHGTQPAPAPSTDRTAVLHGAGNAALSGAMAAQAADALARGTVPPGVHRAAEVLDPAATLRALTADPDGSQDAGAPAARVTWLPPGVDPLAPHATVEEGAL